MKLEMPTRSDDLIQVREKIQHQNCHPEQSEDWPLDAEGQPLMRFRWDEPQKHKDNFLNLQKLCDWVKETGPKYLPQSAPSVRSIAMKDLQAKVISRYNDLAKKFNKREKTLPGEEVSDTQPKSEGVDVKLEPAAPMLASKAQSRRKGVRFNENCII